MAAYDEVLAHTTLSAATLGGCGMATADIRISFASGEGYWSQVGVNARPIANLEPTMGLDGLGLATPWSEHGAGVVRHEVLHSVGLEHEHQRPDLDCGFKPIGEIAEMMGWTDERVRTNFGRLRSTGNYLTTSFDPHSVMLYQLDEAYFVDPHSPCMIRDSNNRLSALDVATLRLLYPQDAITQLSKGNEEVGR